MLRIAYLDCSSGISGDMTLAALIDAGVDLDALNRAVASLGLPGLRLLTTEATKLGFRATQVSVECEPEHEHRFLRDILAMIDASQLNVRQRDTARRIFTTLAAAEARVHGIAVDQVRFHEVGAADSIADIVAAAVAWDLLAVDRIVASPVPTGVGRIKIAHGECAIPAPATAELLRGIPLEKSTIEAELTTPTGAAILAAMVDSFGPMPAMKIERIGYGAGHNDLAERPNILRLFVGEAIEEAAANGAEQVCVLETNLDDTSGELVGYCISRLWDAGALDVYTTAIQMKKNRPAVKLTVLCYPGDAAAMEDIVFSETTTLGVRQWTAARHVLRRQPHTVTTPWGPVEGKIGWLRDDLPRFAPEFESCRRVAATHKTPLREVYEAAQRAFDAEKAAAPARKT
jgi:pyridinium-3,5-bisthiocarboxylic acid mononucleotide nickel chelatase